jgi:hypothetical protein
MLIFSLTLKASDVFITAEIKLALLTHHSTSAFSTKVRTDQGIVTISGRAKNEREKQLAGKLAGEIHGVTAVINLMSITDTSIATLEQKDSSAQECTRCGNLTDVAHSFKQK